MSVLPVASVDELTPDWLTAALGREVSDVSATPVGTGQMGACYRLVLRGDPGLPATLLAKLPTADPAGRDFLHGSYAIETTFYAQLAPTLSIRVPTTSYAAISSDPAQRGVFTLLLEDLAPAVQGDQVRGCTPLQAAAALDNLAGLHAPRWCDPTLLEVEGLSLAGKDEADMLDAVFKDAVEIALGKLDGLVSAADAADLRAIAPYAGAWSVARPERFALVHGDYRLDNLLFHADGRVWAVDWQTLSLGLPARDVAFLLGTGLAPDARRATEEGLVASYHQRLIDLGVEDYAVEDCWDDYRFGMLQGPLIAVLGCAYSSTDSERGNRMFAAMVARSVAAMRDLGTLGLLETL
ncbi:phosphotransferase [Nocardioides humilatus]|uniref:Phosphotransferase n=1 Tax=Nocardioides humilatus TaxID=2607660 RepID=A0A5B1L721_9ACTN|nr:phosphotransferase [Nocardioides humilatus]KAA1416412.1 phosphotransferase [Nocardioides humilatus]